MDPDPHTEFRAFDALATAAGVLGIDGEWRVVNRALLQWMQRVCGVGAGSERPGLFELLGADDAQAVRAETEPLFARGSGRAALECRLGPVGPERRWTALRLAAVANGPQETFVVVELTDVEAERRAESLRAAYVADLEHKCRSLWEFSRSASHDLAEPVRMIANYGRLVESEAGGLLDERSRRFLGYTVDAAERLGRLVSELLAHARLESRAPSFEPVDLGHVFAQALAQLALAIEESGARFDWDASAVPNVLGDRRQLVQLFQNLFSNAIRHRGDRAPRVFAHFESAGRFARITVDDDGPGCALPGDSRAVSERDADPAAPRIGLGLRICQRVVEAHGGSLALEPRPDGGCRVTVTLRAALL